MLRCQLDGTSRPPQRDASFKAAEIVEEPRAASESRLSRADHFEHPEQGLAINLVGNAKALEGLLVDGGIRIDREAD